MAACGERRVTYCERPTDTFVSASLDDAPSNRPNSPRSKSTRWPRPPPKRNSKGAQLHAPSYTRPGPLHLVQRLRRRQHTVLCPRVPTMVIRTRGRFAARCHSSSAHTAQNPACSTAQEHAPHTRIQLTGALPSSRGPGSHLPCSLALSPPTLPPSRPSLTHTRNHTLPSGPVHLCWSLAAVPCCMLVLSRHASGRAPSLHRLPLPLRILPRLLILGRGGRRGRSC